MMSIVKTMGKLFLLFLEYVYFCALISLQENKQNVGRMK